MVRGLAYFYALVFALLINPFQSWLGVLSGWWLQAWDRLYADLATGVLFGYAALIAMEILIRTQLFSSEVRKARPRVTAWLTAFSVSVGFTGIAAAIFLWAISRPYDEIGAAAYWAGIVYCGIALIILMYAVHIETVSKNVTDETLAGESA